MIDKLQKCVAGLFFFKDWSIRQLRAVRRALTKNNRSILLDELAESQNVQPVKDVRALYGTWPGEIDDGFEEAIEKVKKEQERWLECPNQ